MPSNQNPVYVDGTSITGDGTVEEPLAAVGGGGGAPGGVIGDAQFNDGAGGFASADGIHSGVTVKVDEFGDILLITSSTTAIEAGLLELVGTTAVSIPGLQAFANNADAIAGGLTVGQLYRTGSDPDTVCVVD